MELFIGIGLVIFGGLLAYHNLKDTVHGEKSAFVLGVGLLIVGIYLIKDFNDAAERSRAENDRQWEMEQQRILNRLNRSNHGENIHFGGASGYNGAYKCGSTGCWCRIKRSELEASGLNRCGCGHLTSYHHD